MLLKDLGVEYSNEQNIREALSRFLQLVAPGDKPCENVRAFVFAGMASPGGFETLNSAMETLFSELGRSQVLKTIKPSYVGAFGAACAAKSQADDPKQMKDYIDAPSHIPDESTNA